MLISGEIIAHELEKYLFFHHIKEDSGMRLVSFRLWNKDNTNISKDCL